MYMYVLAIFFDDMSFKDALEELSAYLLWKNPPKCVSKIQSNQRFDVVANRRFAHATTKVVSTVKMGHFHMKSKLNRVFENIGFEGLDKMNIGSMESTEVLGKVLS